LTSDKAGGAFFHALSTTRNNRCEQITGNHIMDGFLRFFVTPNGAIAPELVLASPDDFYAERPLAVDACSNDQHGSKPRKIFSQTFLFFFRRKPNFNLRKRSTGSVWGEW